MSTNQRVLLVVNPISGDKDKFPIIEAIRISPKAHGSDFKIYKTTGDRDKEDLTALIDRYEPSRIFIIGGDGTIKLVAEILKDDQIPLSIFPAGSANGLAENLDLPSDYQGLIEVGLGDHFVTVDTIAVNEELCLHISDVGLNAALIRNYQEGTIRGKLGYALHSIPTLMKSDFPFQFEMEQDGRSIQRKAVLVAIANARKYGTGSTINPDGKFDDGLFEVLVFKKFDIPEILKTFRENVELSSDFLEIFSTSKINLTCTRNIPLQIDGEYRGEVKKVHAEISPIRIKIAVPPKKASRSGNRMK